MTRPDFDVLVVGSGIAGLTFALRVAERFEVALITKKTRPESSTNWAQGGIAAVIDSADSTRLHRADTLRAGAGLCHHERVTRLVEYGPQAVRDLIDWGVRFSQKRGELALGIEAGHSRRRIVHSRDQTGLAIESALLQAVAEHARIHLHEDHMATDLLVAGDDSRRRCTGARVLDVAKTEYADFRSHATLLATGGCGATYRHTTNPGIATGDGVAMAVRAGAAVANMEFVQFHPTALYPTGERAFLISEAVRGEGAVLRNAAGEAFMERYHAAADLAPRDVVARAVHQEMRTSGQPHVWLDATALQAERIEDRFPNILRNCLDRGIDMREEPIPVVPAAHYSCGGIWTDMSGRSTIGRLLAAGECSCTGVHGANRLASNSLLEAVVFAERAATRVARDLDEVQGWEDGDAIGESTGGPQDAASAREVREVLADLLWERLGIVREHAEIEEALDEIERLRGRWDGGGGDGSHASSERRSSLESIEAANILQVAGLIARSASWRKESRGLHYDLQFPYRNNESYLRDTIVRGVTDPRTEERRPGAGPGAGVE